jgi:hypothetical protein
MRRVTLTIPILLLAAGSATADPTTEWPTPQLAPGERFAGTVVASKGSEDAPPQRWVSPTGHAVTVAQIWSKDRVVVRALWNDPKPRVQDVVAITGPVKEMPISPFLQDHTDGRLVVGVTGAIAGVDRQSYGYLLKFDPRTGFKIVKQEKFAKGTGPAWMFAIGAKPGPASRLYYFGADLRQQRDPATNLVAKPVKVTTRTGTGKTATTADAVVDGRELVKQWITAGRYPAIGFAAKCDDRTGCCTIDGSKLSRWLHIERVCLQHTTVTELELVTPR